MAEKKKAGFFRRTVDKVRKKVAPTFDEQFGKARKERKKTFRSTRDDKKKGKLEYSTMTKGEVAKKIAKSKAADAKARSGKGGGADTGKKPVYEKATGTKVSNFGQAFRAAKKAGKKEFTFKGKKYTTLLKGEKEKKPLIEGKGFFGKKINISKPELSGKTSKKIKKAVRGNTTGFDIQGARKGGLIRGIPKLAKKGF
jgi:hypothetical protein